MESKRDFFSCLTWGWLPFWLVSWDGLKAPTEGMRRSHSLFLFFSKVPDIEPATCQECATEWDWCLLPRFILMGCLRSLRVIISISIWIGWNRFENKKHAQIHKFFSAVVCIPHRVTELFLASQRFDWSFAKICIYPMKTKMDVEHHHEFEEWLHRPSTSMFLFRYACLFFFFCEFVMFNLLQ